MPTHQLSRGSTFVDGSSGNTASQLHQLVDNGTILPGAITEQSIATPAAGDTLLFYQGTSGSLKQTTVTGILASIPRNGPNNIAAMRVLGPQAGAAAPGNDTRFPSQITGVRKGNGVAVDTVAKPKDFAFVSKNLIGITAIDWDAADVFYDTLAAPKTYTFTNLRDGRKIRLRIKTAGNAVTWTYTLITGESKPVLTGATNNIYYVTFENTPVGVSGYVTKSF